MPITIKKSPRAPSISLKDAIERALRAYDRERLHEAPTEVVAQNIGYKNANSGSALSAIASLRYFGLLIRTRNGFLAVAKDVEALKYAPSESQKKDLLINFLTKPSLYEELLKKYVSGLPSDATLKYELIERGFIPGAAETALGAFKESVEFAQYFQLNREDGESQDAESENEVSDEEQLVSNLSSSSQPNSQSVVTATNSSGPAALTLHEGADDSDRIPVRLSGGRKAWLVIPAPFYSADKQRLKAQIDLLLTEDENIIS